MKGILSLLLFITTFVGHSFCYAIDIFSDGTPQKIKVRLHNTSILLSKNKQGNPYLNIHNIQPLYQFANDALLYSKVNLTIREFETRFKIYGGYRRRIFKKGIFGLTIFYDNLNKSRFRAMNRTFFREGTRFHQLGTGVEIYDKRYGRASVNSYLATTDVFSFNNMEIKSRVSEGFDIEIGIPLYSKKYNLMAQYQWLNMIYREDYKAVGAKIEVEVVKGLNTGISYTKRLSVDSQGTDTYQAFLTLTVHTDRLRGTQSARHNSGGSYGKYSPLFVPGDRQNPLKIEGKVRIPLHADQ